MHNWQMTSPVESKSPSWWLYASPLAAGALRAVISTPLDAVGTLEIVHHQNTLQVLKRMIARDYWKGFQPNLLKFVTRTPVQFAAVKVSSSMVPTDYDAAIRGLYIGVLSSGLETATVNGWNALRTRFIQGQSWGILRQEGVSVLTKGLTSALIHRSLSGAIFWATHEKLREKFPDQNAAVRSTLSGWTQVLSTAPWHIAAIYGQRVEATPEYLHRTLLYLFKTRGWQGLIFTALVPRLVLSAATSAPLMWLMTELNLIHRKS